MKRVSAEMIVVLVLVVAGAGVVLWKTKFLNRGGASRDVRVATEEVPSKSVKPIPSNRETPAESEVLKSLRAIPNDKVPELAGCSSKIPATSGYFILESELRNFYRGQMKINFGTNPFYSCSRVGDEVLLISKGSLGGYPAVNGSGKVVSLTARGNVQVEVVSPLFGRVGLLPKLCTDGCDKVVTKLASPEVPADATAVLVTNNNETLDERHWRGEKITISPSRPYKSQFKSKDFKKNFVVLTGQPTSENFDVLNVMRYLRGKGAKSVLWYYDGLAGLRNLPLLPPDIPGLPVIDHLGLAKMLDYLPVYVGGAEPSQLLVKSARIPPPKTFTRPYVTPMDWKNQTIATSWQITSPDVQSKTQTYVIYGDHRGDWRAYYALLKLRQAGYPNLYWLKGGLDEMSISEVGE